MKMAKVMHGRNVMRWTAFRLDGEISTAAKATDVLKNANSSSAGSEAVIISSGCEEQG